MRSDSSKKLSVLLYSDTNEIEQIQKCVDSIFVTSGLSPEMIQVLFLKSKSTAWEDEKWMKRGFVTAGDDGESVQTEEDAEEPEVSDIESENGKEEPEENEDTEDQTEIPNTDQTVSMDVNEKETKMTLDELLDCLKEQYTESLEIVDVDEREEPQAYNFGMEKATGEYVAFMRASSWYSENALKILAPENGTDARMISLQPVYSGKDGMEIPYSILPGKSGRIDGMIQPDFIQLVFHAYLFRQDLLDGFSLREDLHEEAFTEAVLELQSRNDGKFQYKSEDIYYYTAPLEDNEAESAMPRQSWWYIDSVQNFLLPFMKEKKSQYEGAVPRYIQKAVYYLMSLKFKYNLEKHDKLVLKKEEALIFYDLCSEILTMIDNDIVYNAASNPEIRLPRPLRMAFLKAKAEKTGCRRIYSSAGNQLLCSYKTMDENQIIARFRTGKLSGESVNFRVINYENGKLEMDGNLQLGGYLSEDECEFYGEISGSSPVRIPVERTAVYDLQKCFGVTYSRKCSVHFEVPVSELLGEDKRLTFYVNLAGRASMLQMKFISVNSRLLNETEKAYWCFDGNKYILYREGQSLRVEKNSILKNLKREIALNLKYLKMKEADRKEVRSCVGLRILYWLTRPYYKKKRIWMTYDKLYKAGDNGEYFFRYCQTQKDGIDCYYVINGDSEDCARLEKEYGKMVLRRNTLRCRLLALHAEATMSTHANPIAFVGFPGTQIRFIKGLFHADDVCIQHGLTIQKIAQIQNRIVSNTKLYCCASPFEVKNIEHPIYGYDPDMIKLTGLARYDGLKSNDKKQILITPTWRSYLAMPAVMGSTRPYNPDFKYTDYFRIYENLISDDKLIETARRTGYELIYLLHPVVSSQKEDYTVKDGVKLLSALEISYEQILTESSLMVTDYSGVQYDFAYQRKPVVYYHPDALPPHYGEGGMDYENMGFGPICKEHEDLVDRLCEYMEKGCRMEEKYLERVNQFFTYNDFNNSQRIYDEVLRMENRADS